MSVEQNKAIILRFWFDSAERGLKAVDELFADDFVRYSPDGKMGKAQFRQLVDMLQKAFPDSRSKIDGLVAEGDRVAFHYVLTGTDKGGYRGNPPTGKRFSFTQANFCVVRGGKITELRVFPVAPSVDEQLGIKPKAQRGE